LFLLNYAHKSDRTVYPPEYVELCFKKLTCQKMYQN
jgi:hypothetical protein